MTDEIGLGDLLPSGSVWALTTRTRAGGLRTRPVTVLHGSDPWHVVVLTGAAAEKVAEARADPAVTVARPIPRGWVAIEGTAEVVLDETVVAAHLRAAGVEIPASPIAVLRIRPIRARRWETASERPWDNTCHELTLRVPPPRAG